MEQSSPTFDIIGVGSLAVDDIIHVELYPAPDTKTRVLRRERRYGGLTGTALATAARLGASCAYAGRLGTDAVSRSVTEALENIGINTTHAPTSSSFSVTKSTVIVAPGTRNVFSSADGLTGADEHFPASETLRDARVLLVDHHGLPGAIRAASIARATGIDVVGDFERYDSPLLFSLFQLVNHLILSEAFALSITDSSCVAEAIQRLAPVCRGNIIITSGASGCWFQSGSEVEARLVPSAGLQGSDTLGCGDVFRGAYAFQLSRGGTPTDCVKFAGLVAGIKAKKGGDWSCLPTLAEVSGLQSEAAPYPQA